MKKTIVAAVAIALILVAAVVVLITITLGVPTLKITSSAFLEGGAIPAKYAAPPDGDDVSPPLSIGSVPTGTKSLALICDDPDAPGGTWVHWVIWNISPENASIPENIPTTNTVESLGGAKQGANSWGNIGYGGPSPPSGTHRYYFRVYALDTMLELSAGSSRAQLDAAMQGHILAQGALMGKYSA